MGHPHLLLIPTFFSFGQSWEGTAFRSDFFLPGTADGDLLREVTDRLGLGVGERDDVVVLAPVLVHGRVEDAAGGGAGSEPGVAQPRDRGSRADNSGVVALHELFIHLLVPLLPQGGLTKRREGFVSGERALALCLPSLAARLLLKGLTSSGV